MNFHMQGRSVLLSWCHRGYNGGSRSPSSTFGGCWEYQTLTCIVFKENLYTYSNINSSIVRVLKREAEKPQTSGKFHKVVANSVLLYGMKTWAMVQRILGSLERMHR